jgi:predicted ATPase
MGGCGKTRLATHVARELLEEFPHGVWFIDLAPLTRAELVTQHVLVTLGVREEPGIPVLHTLVNYLRDKQILLLMDNCEHLIQVVSQLTEILQERLR